MIAIGRCKGARVAHVQIRGALAGPAGQHEQRRLVRAPIESGNHGDGEIDGGTAKVLRIQGDAQHPAARRDRGES